MIKNKPSNPCPEIASGLWLGGLSSKILLILKQNYMNNKNKKFYFTVNATIYEDSYKEGQGDQVNFWQVNELIDAPTLDLAIEKLFETKLYFSYKKELSQSNDGDAEIKNILEYSNSVDEDNNEILEDSKQYQAWKEGKAILYACDLSIKIFELNAVNMVENLQEFFKRNTPM